MSGTELYADNASTNVAGSLTPSSTTLSVTTGTAALFPNPAAGQYFLVTLTDAASKTLFEIVKVTAVAGDNITIVRGQEGTAARSWSVGDIVFNAFTAGSAANLVQQSQLQVQAGNYAISTGTANAIVLTLSTVPVSQASLIGAPIRFATNSFANTGPVTININSLGNQSLVLPGGGAVPAGALAGNTVFSVVYDGSNYELQSLPAVLSPAGPAGGDLNGTYPNPSVDYGAGVPPGVVWMYANTSVPPGGWLICDGSAVSRSTYAALFSAIGTAFGVGNGSTTFNLPNTLGQFPRGYDSGGAVDPGRTFGVNQGQALQNHNHLNGVGSTTGSGSIYPYGTSTTGVPGSSTNTAHTDANTVQQQGYTSTGTGGSSAAGTFATETRPVNFTTTFIIKT